jgi:hypothetical protein
VTSDDGARPRASPPRLRPIHVAACDPLVISRRKVQPPIMLRHALNRSALQRDLMVPGKPKRQLPWDGMGEPAKRVKNGTTN